MLSNEEDFDRLDEALADVGTVLAAGESIDLGDVLDDLGERKVERLMVEGGGSIHTQSSARDWLTKFIW